MANAAEIEMDSWIAATVARLWPDNPIAAITPLKGDASSRRFWRVSMRSTQVPHSAIAIDLGPDDLPLYARALKLVPEPLPEPPWLNLHRHLMRIGADVPALYAADTASRMLLVEDVGSTPLFEAAEGGDAADLYRIAIDQLMLLHTAGTDNLDDNCMAGAIAYDERLFRWELQQFTEAGLSEVAPGADSEGIAMELDQLAARLGDFPRVFSHRDYHGHNLFLQRESDTQLISHPARRARVRLIDFQDALMAPAAQDLAVLLTTRDTSRVITQVIERRLLDYYYAGLIRREAPRLSPEEFHQSYRLCVLQHALKVIGRFITLEREGKSGYRKYIPFALAQARRMLSDEFPALSRAIAA